MESHGSRSRKAVQQLGHQPGRDQQHGDQLRQRPALLTSRSALILALAALVTIGAAILLDLAHRPVALIVLSTLAIFAGAVKFFDWLIE
jgi:hypothetical protein